MLRLQVEDQTGCTKARVGDTSDIYHVGLLDAENFSIKILYHHKMSCSINAIHKNRISALQSLLSGMRWNDILVIYLRYCFEQVEC